MTDDPQIPTIVPRAATGRPPDVTSLRVIGADGSEADLDPVAERVLVETGLYRLSVVRPDSCTAARRVLDCLEDYETEGRVRLHAVTVTTAPEEPGLPEQAVADALFSWEPTPVEPRAL